MSYLCCRFQTCCCPEFQTGLTRIGKMKKSLFIIPFVLLSAPVIAAVDPLEQLPITAVAVQKDTSIVNDSLNQQPLNNPKKIFQDLFISNPGGSINSVQLNPRAASFVED